MTPVTVRAWRSAFETEGLTGWGVLKPGRGRMNRNEFTDTDHAQCVVAERCFEFYNTVRRHSSAAMMSPIAFEARTTADDQPVAA